MCHPGFLELTATFRHERCSASGQAFAYPHIKECGIVEWIIVIVLVVLLLGALGPRAGWYGVAGGLWDILTLIVAVVLLIWILRLLGVLAF